MDNINWYPGHMKKTREMIEENQKKVDLVLEVLDARIVWSSKNPVINEILGEKSRVILLNKADLADEKITEEWVVFFRDKGINCKKVNGITGEGIKEVFRLLEREKEEKNRDREVKRPFRVMIVGVPNVGKSSLINRLTRSKGAKTGDKPGVTKGKQWLNMGKGMQLLDTPGILWPKFQEEKVALHLAFCNSIKDEIIDLEGLSIKLLDFLKGNYPQRLEERYGIEITTEDSVKLMEDIGGKRGFIMTGGRIDYLRTARAILEDFRSGKLGQISLESPAIEGGSFS